MDGKVTFWIKEEEREEDPVEQDNTRGRAAVMDGKVTIWIKEEEREEDPVEQDNTFVEDPLEVSWSTDFIKEEHEINLEVDETESIVFGSTSFASSSTRLSRNGGESCSIPFEETANEEMGHAASDIGTEESTDVTRCGRHTQQYMSPGTSLYNTGLKCSLRENRFHKFSCSLCQQSFTTKYDITVHVFVHIDGVQPPEYICRLCGEVFLSDCSLTEHCEMCEVDKALSAGSNEKFDIGDEYENTFMHGVPEIYFMEQTDNQSSQKESLETSKKSVNGIGNTHNFTDDAKKKDRYDNCGTSKTSKVNTHTAQLTAKEPHLCGVCGKCFTLSWNLKQHSLIHSGRKPHKCEICGKAFTRLGSLKIHGLTHTGLRPHNCDICGKSFTASSDLKKHSLTHTNRRPHKCDICGKSLTTSSTLKKHALIHSNTRPHRCDICGKSFTYSSDLKNHLLVHSRMKSYKCDSCGKFFTTLSNLKQHSMRHAENKPHKCGTCGKSFTRVTQLVKHALRHTERTLPKWT